MKKLLKISTICLAIAMVFGLTGCGESKTELEKELEAYQGYNHIVQESSDRASTSQYFMNEDSSYDEVSSYNKDYEGISVHITGKHGALLEEENEERGTGTSKYTAFLDKYTYTEISEKGTTLNGILDNMINSYKDAEFDIVSDGDAKIFTADLNDDESYSKLIIVFETNKITATYTEIDGREKTKVWTFENIEEDTYTNFVENVKSLDGATRAQVKEKIGDFVDKYHTSEDY